jgi:hypothetical protein
MRGSTGRCNNPTGLKEAMASYGSRERCLPAVRCESLTKIRIAPSAPHFIRSQLMRQSFGGTSQERAGLT